VQLTVFAAETANPLKLERMRKLGADVGCQGRDFDEAKEAARHYAHATGATFVEDGREVAITEGAGTIGLELARIPAPLDAVLVPLGNGALVNGIGTWLKAERPSTRVIAVAAEGAPAMAHAWRRGTLVTTERADTIADGIAVRVPVPEALELMKQTVDEVLLVSDEMLIAAMRLARDSLGVVLEPAGAAGLAAALAFKARFQAQRIATPLCGSNLTEEQFARWLC
jgi:threonine dehydratase